MDSLQRDRILEQLKNRYGGSSTALLFSGKRELLIAVMLSAQATDIQVNRVTEKLFCKYRSWEEIAVLEPSVFEEEIKSIGLHRTKSRNIVKTAFIIISRFGGEVPGTVEELMSLPGVGRKTANVVLSCGFGIPAIAVDTHVARTAVRLGFSREKTPEKIEEDLRREIPERDWSAAHHWLIWHGRKICRARKPLCEECFLREECPFYRDSQRQM